MDRGGRNASHEGRGRGQIRMTRSILHVVTNVSHYADPDEPTGENPFSAKATARKIVAML